MTAKIQTLQGNPLPVTKLKPELGATHRPTCDRAVVPGHQPMSTEHSSEGTLLIQKLLTRSGEHILLPVIPTSWGPTLALLLSPPELVRKRGGNSATPNQIEKQRRWVAQAAGEWRREDSCDNSWNRRKGLRRSAKQMQSIASFLRWGSAAERLFLSK